MSQVELESRFYALLYNCLVQLILSVLPNMSVCLFVHPNSDTSPTDLSLLTSCNAVPKFSLVTYTLI